MNLKRPYRLWTAADTAQLRKLFGTLPRGEVAARMNRHADYISKKARLLGLVEQPAPIIGTLLPHIAAAGEAGTTVDALATATGHTPAVVGHGVREALQDRHIFRHRDGPRFLYFATAEQAQASARRARTELLKKKRETERLRYADKMAEQGKTVRARGGPKPAKTTEAATIKPKGKPGRPRQDTRPGAEQLVTLPGRLAPVRTAPSRGPAHQPGQAHIPRGLVIQRGPDTRDTRYSAAPDAYGLGLAASRPGEYSHADAPRPWASAAVASRTGSHGA